MLFRLGAVTQRLGAVALLAVATAACGASQSQVRDPSSEASDPCYDADIAVKRVWNHESRVRVRAQVMQWGAEIGTEVAEKQALSIDSSMDRLTDDWARMRKAVCKDHFARHTLTAQEYQQRADCLDAMLARQRSFLEALASPRTDVDAQLASIGEALKGCR